MKGQSVIISTVLSILIQTIVVLAVMFSFNNIYKSRKQNIIRLSAYSLCKQIRNEMLGMHDGDNFLNITDSKFSVLFRNSTIYIKGANISCTAPGFKLNGIASGGSAEFHLKSFNGTVFGWVE